MKRMDYIYAGTFVILFIWYLVDKLTTYGG